MALGLQKKLQLQANLGLDAILGGAKNPIAGLWILLTGAWADAGVWDDTAVWKDS